MKHPADLHAAALRILAQTPYLTLASICPDGTPWNSPVFTAYDPLYRFYFSTVNTSHKARNFAANPAAGAVVYDSTATPGTGLGVYMTGNVERLFGSSDLDAAYSTLAHRRAPVAMSHPLTDYAGQDAVLGLYRFTPERVMMNTEDHVRGISVDRKVDIDLMTGQTNVLPDGFEPPTVPV